tara:strand:+ start:10687 stop:10968 length:282 start_codon:yes stop_codon:yes gene_type:complete
MMGKQEAGWGCKRHPDVLIPWPSRVACILPQMLFDKDLTRRDLSKRTGISYRETCRIVAGTVKMIQLNTMMRIALALDEDIGSWWVIIDGEKP